MTYMSTFSDEKHLQIETFGGWLCLHILCLHCLGTSIIYPGTLNTVSEDVWTLKPNPKLQLKVFASAVGIQMNINHIYILTDIPMMSLCSI